MDEMEIAKSFAVLQRRTQGYVADAASPLGLTYGGSAFPSYITYGR